MRDTYPTACTLCIFILCAKCNEAVAFFRLSSYFHLVPFHVSSDFDSFFSSSSSSLFPFSHVVPSRCDSVLYRSERKKGSRKSLLCHSCSQSSCTSVNGKCVCDVHTVHLHTRRGYSRVTFVSRTTLHSCAFLPKKAVYS